MRRTGRGLLGMAAGAMIFASLPMAAQGQEWEELSTSRRVGDETSVDVRVRYGVGNIRLRSGDAGTLYRMGLRYDADHFEPVAEYRSGRLELGVETVGRSLNLKGDQDRGELDLEFSPDVSMDLVLELGAVRANLDLGGLTLTDLEPDPDRRVQHRRRGLRGAEPGEPPGGPPGRGGRCGRGHPGLRW